MKSESIGSTDSSHYTTVPSEVGPEILCIEALAPDDEQQMDGIYVPNFLHVNQRMHHYRIVKQGVRVEGLVGTKEGDYVFIDMLARYADTFPISFVNAKSVLFKTDSEAKAIEALKGRIIVKCVEPSEKVNEFGFIQKSDVEPYGIVVSIGCGCEERGFKIGDRLTMVSSDDAATYMFRKDKYFDYHFTIPIAKFAD